ncbi:MAG: ribonuclease E/G [Rhodospirillaceae bacterium]
MSKNMLIDGTHPEEIRVVVLSGNRLEEFDVETSTKKQLKGNIYLAKVTRVEPSLQAAFVEYGGNRHGFLAFNEIHPDYYQIPMEDREALRAEQASIEMQSQAARAHVDDMDGEVIETGDRPAGDDEGASAQGEDHGDDGEHDGGERANGRGHHADENGEPVRRRPFKHYKIQEVIKRRQILLVQVVKEERGNKGAALTTYLSLAGRYCVLMPNTARGGGISRKITSATARRKLKDILNDLEVPEGMAVILRTAGLERNRSEIKRDFEFLMRSWDNIRELTLRSSAPALVYEEGDIIKRAIRDLYTKDIEEIQIEGGEAYQNAKTFMRLLMPSHAKRVQPYRNPELPLFHRYQVEGQLDLIHSPTVQLRSGGYIVINPTEALVAVDVNSGRSTRERNIEETALKTNLEAADEVARQMRLRDLAGLIVIDFIDMDESRNVRLVEKRLKDAVKNDRARIQIGRISTFGLMEMSRQRLRPSVLESSTQICPHCRGSGHVRSTESSAVRVLRALEEEGIRKRSAEVAVNVATPIALYLLNVKRAMLVDIESRYGFTVAVQADDSLIPPDFRIDRLRQRTEGEVEALREVAQPAPALPAPAPEPEEEAAEAAAERPAADRPADEEEQPRRRRRRRRRGRGSDRETPAAAAETAEDEAPDDAEAPVAAEAEPEREPAEAEAAAVAGETEETAGERTEDGQGRRRRRGRRGGRRRHRDGEGESEIAASAGEEAGTEAGEEGVAPEAGMPVAEPVDALPPPDTGTEVRLELFPHAPIDQAPVGATRVWQTTVAEPEPVPPTVEPAPEPAVAAPEAEPVHAAPAHSETFHPETAHPETVGANGGAAMPAAAEPEPAPPSPITVVEIPSRGEAAGAADDGDGTKRRGWWQRLIQP